MKNRVLIIDDDKELCVLLKKCVNTENIEAEICYSGDEGINKLLSSQFKLVVLDIMMPGMDGFTTLKKIRKLSKVPVLMLTSKTESTDKVRGLRSGADDYLTKPFDIEEFIARVLSLIRRYTTLNDTNNENKEILSFNGLEIDKGTRTVTANGVNLDLPVKEFDILYYLAKNKGRILTKQQIYEEVWKEQYAYDDSNIMALISRIRKKIEPDVNNPTYIQTVRGLGYRFSREV